MTTNIDFNCPWLIIPESWKHPEAKAEKPAEKPAKKQKREPAQWRPMTYLEIEAAQNLGRCRLPPRTSTKRLAGHIAAQALSDEPKITDNQAEYLWKFCWTYRRQIASTAVVKEAKRRRNQ